MQQKGIYAEDELREADLDDLLSMHGKIVSPSEIGILEYASMWANQFLTIGGR